MNTTKTRRRTGHFLHNDIGTAPTVEPSPKKTTPGMTALDDQEWVTYPEVLAYLRASRATVNKWRARPELNFPKPVPLPNGSLLFRRAEVVAWLLGRVDGAA